VGHRCLWRNQKGTRSEEDRQRKSEGVTSVSSCGEKRGATRLETRADSGREIKSGEFKKRCLEQKKEEQSDTRNGQINELLH